MKLLFATHNPHKAQEIRDIFLSSGSALEITSLVELGDMEEIVESGDTLVENALIKAREGYARHGLDCFADDTGLEVEALDGRPGVYSARYAGPECRAEDNIQKLLGELQGIQNRSARFRTVVALILDGKEHLFEGVVNGQIIDHKTGAEGFGYDPIFQPNGYSITFGEMCESEKNKISHRGMAIQKLIAFLKNQEV
nr:RdgB/HAM1 family non-canonical purine NTP pyrophosphatase [uncultured Porphyromonas sp.]